MSEEFKVGDKVWFSFAFSAECGVIQSNRNGVYVIKWSHGVTVKSDAEILGRYVPPPKKWWQFWRNQ